jgi:hypothetical protein
VTLTIPSSSRSSAARSSGVTCMETIVRCFIGATPGRDTSALTLSSFVNGAPHLRSGAPRWPDQSGSRPDREWIVTFDGNIIDLRKTIQTIQLIKELLPGEEAAMGSW